MSGEKISKRSRILVADDDQSIRQLVCTIVKREHFTVDCVADGVEAIEMLQEREYALILLDLMMPRVDGFGVIEFLREHQPLHKPIVLIFSAYADQRYKDVDPTIVAGVLRKPFEVADLGALIRMCVNGFERATNDLLLSNDPAIRALASKRPR